MSVDDGIAYQATDLARNHREVIDAARRGSALIREKDGLALVMAPAKETRRTREIGDLALDLVRAASVMLPGGAARTAAAYGGMAWRGQLHRDDRDSIGCLGGIHECLDVVGVRRDDDRWQGNNRFCHDDGIDDAEDVGLGAKHACLLRPFGRCLDLHVDCVDDPIDPGVVLPSGVDLGQDRRWDDDEAAFTSSTNNHRACPSVALRES